MANTQLNRTLQNLRDSKDQLSGMDGMELRGWASSNSFRSERDLSDELGALLLATMSDKPTALSSYIRDRTAELGGVSSAVAQELFDARWGPTKIPIYSVILQFLFFTPDNKDHLLDLTRYLATDVKVSVHGVDVLGCTALYWSVSTKPFTEPEFAQILFDAGASVNQKNRLGGSAGGEIAQANVNGDTRANVEMLKWWFQHGGDVDAKDNDGMSVRILVEMMQKKVPAMTQVVEEGRGERSEEMCWLCGRMGSKLMACKRCKSVKYCSQECQKVDWKIHKKTCAPAEK